MPLVQIDELVQRKVLNEISGQLLEYDQEKISRRRAIFERWNTHVFQPLNEKIKADATRKYHLHRRFPKSKEGGGKKNAGDTSAKMRLGSQEFLKISKDEPSEFGPQTEPGSTVPNLIKRLIHPINWSRIRYTSTIEGNICRITNPGERPPFRLKYPVKTPRPSLPKKLYPSPFGPALRVLNETQLSANPEFPRGKRVYSVYLKRNPLLLL
jgi:hypothetical protein